MIRHKLVDAPDYEFGTFGVILADPPWEWKSYDKTGKGRSSEAHYDLMDLNAIKKMPVSGWAKEDAVLFLWVYNSMLPDGLDVMNAWGFDYKARGFTWVKVYPDKQEESLFPMPERKPRVGMGKWTRLSTELCLLGTRGSPKVLSHSVREVIMAPIREHSRKPDEIYERIELLAAGPYLELFASSATEHRKGWTRWVGKDRAPERRWASDSYPGAK